MIATILLAAASPAAPALLPTPGRIEAAGEGFRLADDVPLVADDPGARAAAARFAALMGAAGVRLTAARSSGAVAVRFRRTPGLANEAYRLTVDPSGATIAASDDAGLLYGAVTLWQLATQDATHRIAGTRIDDAPRFGWRGLMLDSARHFQSPAFIRRVIDAMAASKLNRLHWHLVDDQGWRLPVPKWPKLTTASAWRRPATARGAPPLPAIGGFYSEVEIRDIVAYAAARNVTIVPEIEMPGHALAAIRAYPQLGMGVPIPPGTESDYGVFPWLYNSRPETFGFLEDVLDQVMRLFPSRWVHIGGDEAVKDQWRASPAVQAQIRALGLKDEEALQGWFMARMAGYLQQHGRRAIGWDEILEGGVPTDVAITSWRGTKGAVTAAKAGHDAVLSPAPTLYINNRQGTGPQEPPSHGALMTLATVLGFDPVPDGLSRDEARHILGLQANLWTEHIDTEPRAAWMLFPRALAVAEIGWAGPTKRSVADFTPAAVAQLDRLRGFGLTGADSAWAVNARLDRAGDGRVTTTLATQAGLPIRYTLDGSTPTPLAPRYDGPLALPSGSRVRAASFLGARMLPGAIDRVVTTAAALTRTSRELSLCGDDALDLPDDAPANGPRAHFLINILEPCWRWDAAPLAGITRIALSVGQLPFNFQVGDARDRVRFRPPATQAGEFELRDGCDGALLATLPLAPAAGNPAVTRLEARLKPGRGATNLCISYTARGVDPLWAVERIELLP